MPEFTSEQLGTISPAAEKNPDAPSEPSKEKLENASIVASGRKDIAEAVRKELENEDYKTEIDSRRKYAKGLFRLVSWWIFAILVILLLQGFMGRGGMPLDVKYADIAHTSSEWKGVLHFELSENVLLALIGGTTAGVLGLFHIVAVHFFPEKK